MTRATRWLRCYPAQWRERYGDDLTAYLEDRYGARLPLRAVISLVVGGARERARGSACLAAAPAGGDRIRTGAVTVLVAWSAFVVAGSSFAKLSEHFDMPLSDRTRALPDLAYVAMQVVATLSGLAVVAGLALALPAVVRFLSGGGWPAIRRHVARAAAVTGAAGVLTVPLLVWAHQLSPAQRNGDSTGYGLLFVGWCVLVVLAIVLWTVVIIATARRLELSRLVVLADGALAVTATAGMFVMTVAAAVWWGAMASSAPSFLGGGAFGPTSPWNPQLVATLALMLGSLIIAAFGVVRIVRAG